MLKIRVILGSTRPGRNSEAVGRWVHCTASRRDNAMYEWLDLADFNLPLVATIREHVMRSLGQDREGSRAFTLTAPHEEAPGKMLDQTMAWAGALQGLPAPAGA